MIVAMSRRDLLISVAVAVLSAFSVPAPGHPERSQSGFVSSRISVVTRGRGPDIVLIPGLAAHRDVWTGVAGQLDRRYRLHLVQVKGFAGFAPGANANGPL